MSFTLMIDLGVAALLIIMIFYAVSLNNRLKRLRADKNQLEALSKDFDQSTLRVEESMARLRQAAADIQLQIGRTETLRDDLKFLGDRGASTADRLEELVREARDNLGIEPGSTNRLTTHAATDSLTEKVQQSKEKSAEAPSDAEKKLLEVLRATNT